jgi:hypothetical protein
MLTLRQVRCRWLTSRNPPKTSSPRENLRQTENCPLPSLAWPACGPKITSAESSTERQGPLRSTRAACVKVRRVDGGTFW